MLTLRRQGYGELGTLVKIKFSLFLGILISKKYNLFPSTLKKSAGVKSASNTGRRLCASCATATCRCRPATEF